MTLLVKGKLVSGIGAGSRFVGLEWVKRQVHEKFGFEPYLGTLNLKMDEETSNRFQSFARSQKGILIEPIDETFCEGKCFKARIEGKIDGALVIPCIPSYPRDQIEVIAPINLRETLGLEDGDEVTIEILYS